MSSKLSRFLSILFVKDYNCIVCGRELAKTVRWRICNNCYAKTEVIGGVLADECEQLMKEFFKQKR